MNVTGSEAPDGVPSSSWVAVIVCEPSTSGVLGASDQVPSSATVAVPRTVLPSVTVTVAPGGRVPVMAGVRSVRGEPRAGGGVAGASLAWTQTPRLGAVARGSFGGGRGTVRNSGH